ncbi:nicotinamide phosphoribosyltransferase [Arthrobacter ginsengisoli]|uniref:Nicotinamide phosphoribosyltransferase n=1 Tax=Arthrobacter ginsengisoli TaxID=1356565 RepID=A0ABU1U6M9_9MICC|nr:nicotinate phosphoribosyltransferase [Arthrobacter ginsengisoli]MDR7080791.1 nicotinamide phosphoribosyltransferase [Arthrobacter ginsengisoli]
MSTATATRITAPSVTAALFETDAYKLGHRDLYPAGTTGILSNYTNRGSRIDGVTKVVHFGLQAFLQSYCTEAFAPFFAAGEDEAVAEYEAVLESILGPNGIAADHIRALHRVGYLPLIFRAVPEGTRVPLRVPTFTIENTQPEFFWLVNYIETVLSAAVWHPSTTATIADSYRTVLDDAADLTGVDRAAVNWQLHDFSYRGMSGTGSAAASGAGHLLSFTGSDSLATIDWVNRYYPSEAGTDNGLVLGSVPATEHSVMCAGISESSELETFERILDKHKSGIVSVVSDTDDFFQVLNVILPALKTRIMERDGKLVIRPDSGDPADIICGTMSRPGAIFTTQVRTMEHDPEFYGAIQLLWNAFGGTTNAKGYKVLDSHIGLIYGDSITIDRAKDIWTRLESLGFASENIVFGVGSYSYQYVTRDTFASAIKATWAKINEVEHNLLKDPKTDSGTKKSATGRLAVTRNADGELALIEKATPEQEAESLLQPVWANGEFIRRQSFADVRAVLGNIA